MHQNSDGEFYNVSIEAHALFVSLLFENSINNISEKCFYVMISFFDVDYMIIQTLSSL